jgi:hypothetical protein
VADIQPADLMAAMAWARQLQEVGAAEEFSIGPRTLEDVYVRRVTPEEHELEAAGAGAGS